VTTTKLEFPYTRTLGPVAGVFISQPARAPDRGDSGADGKVLVPPLEYDRQPVRPWGRLRRGGSGCHGGFMDLGFRPGEKHPLSHPFAFALIRRNGADTALVHAVDSGSEDALSTGMRVTPRWKGAPTGMITDIEHGSQACLTSSRCQRGLGDGASGLPHLQRAPDPNLNRVCRRLLDGRLVDTSAQLRRVYLPGKGTAPFV